MALSSYLWIAVCGGIVGFLMAFGIGANDVANQFGSSVGSKAISIQWAIPIAFVMEFIGAFFLGSQVTDTVRKGIVDFANFQTAPAVLMLGMFCALISAAIWVNGCSRVGLPVSTTHSIVGAIMGFGLAAVGAKGVHWPRIAMIVVSWFLSPLLAGIISSFMYWCMRLAFLKRVTGPEYVYKWGKLVVVILLSLVYVTFFLFLMFKNSLTMNFVCKQGTQGKNKWGFPSGPVKITTKAPCKLTAWAMGNPGAAVGIAFAFATVFTAVTFGIIMFFYKSFLVDWEPDTDRFDAFKEKSVSVSTEDLKEADNLPGSSVTPGPDAMEKGQLPIEGVVAVEGAPESGAVTVSVEKHKTLDSDSGISAGIHQKVFEKDVSAKAVHATGERHHVKAERLFQICQIISAAFGSVAHGSNDVANAIGPLAAIIGIYKAGKVENTVELPWWVMFVGAIGIGIGLTAMGKYVIETVGISLCKITPSRGLCIELGATWITVIGSNLGIPLSTTHCKVGSTIGLGLVDIRYSANRPANMWTKGWYAHTLYQGCCAPILNMVFYPFRNFEKIASLLEWNNAETEYADSVIGVNWILALKIMGGWIFTLLAACGVSALIFSFAVFSPSLISKETLST
eukprot:Platyproteum_vivax@DN5122_c0_g1_i1.p1